MKEPELWLTKAQAMDCLCVGKDILQKVEVRELGRLEVRGTWRYLKSSLRRE